MLETLYIDHLNKYISKKPKCFYIELLTFKFTSDYLIGKVNTKNYCKYTIKLKDLCMLLYHYND